MHCMRARTHAHMHTCAHTHTHIHTPKHSPTRWRVGDGEQADSRSSALLPCEKMGSSGGLFSSEMFRTIVAVKSCEGFIRHRPPGPRPRIHLALPSSLSPQGSIWHRFNIDSTLIRHRFPDLTLFRCRIDVEKMPNRPLSRGGRGGFEGGVRGVCA